VDESWRTAISTYDTNRILIRGHPIEELMERVSFGDLTFLLLSGRLASPKEARLWNAILVAVAEHGPTPPSTMAARVIASGNRRAAEAAVAGGLLAIGDAHGGAGEEAMRMLYEGLRAGEAQPLYAVAEEVVARYRAQGRRVPGIGHRVHHPDPRTVVLWRMAREEGVAQDSITLMEGIAEAASRSAGRVLPVNVDGALAAILVGMEFPPEVGKLAFLLGRCAGIAAHVLEEWTRERPMRIRVPFTYDGPPATG